MGSYSNDTVLWRRGNNDILAAGTNRVTSDRRFRVLHDESNYPLWKLKKKPPREKVLEHSNIG